jgi:site-specific DNA-cytosine methylase
MPIQELLVTEQPHIAKLLSEKELMQVLNLSRTTLWRLRTRGLPTVTLGRTVRYDVERIQQWLDSAKALTPLSEGSTLEASDSRDDLPDCHWSLPVAFDPKHRPQEPSKSATTVRREWWRYPQEAHLLDREGRKYRRLTAQEIGTLQGFPIGWGRQATKDELLLIRGYGDAVPPAFAEQLIRHLPSLVPGARLRTTVEICAGFGGLALGKTCALDLEHLGLVERWEVACEVLRTCGKFPADRIIEADLTDFDWTPFAGKVDLLTGGPPCQPWSVGGLGLGEDDDRDLLGRMPEAIAVVRPKVFVFENVPGLLSGENEAYAHDLVDRLRHCIGKDSYGVAMAVLNAADFGLPQSRRRVFIVGAAGRTSRDIWSFFDLVHAAKTHSHPRLAAQRGLKSWATIAQAVPDWHEQKRQWYRWPQDDGAADGDAPVNEQSDNKLGATRTLRRSIRVGLDWPSRGLKSRLSAAGEWVVLDERDELSQSALVPLLPETNSGDSASDPWYTIGEPMVSLECIRRTLGKRGALVYIDIPRIRTNAGAFDAAERESILDTWLTVVQGLLRRAFALLDDAGAIATLCGIDETPYVRMLLDEIAGPSNYLGTVAWQKNYSPRNMPNMREVSPTHDNVMLFSRRISSLPALALKVPPEGFANRDGDPRGPWNADQKGANKPDCDYEVNVCPYRWTIVSGQLPPGIWRINPKSGVIWGRGADLKTAGNWEFTVRVTDKTGNAFDKRLAICVREDAPAPLPAEIPWLAELDALDKTGPLRITIGSLPIGRSGADYSACLTAAGGKPWMGTTRPGKTAAGGKGRFWEFPLKTLLAAAAEDSVDFKSRDDAIPAIKTYLRGARYTPLNQVSVWLGASKNGGSEHVPAALGDVGYSQDAKKELEALLKASAISETVGISKPARLMARLLALFDNPHGYVIDVGSPAAEMASVATAMGRSSIYVEVRTTTQLREGLLKKRLVHAAQGLHPIPDVVDFLDAPRSEGAKTSRYWVSGSPRPKNADGKLFVVSVGPEFAKLDRATGTCLIDYETYVPNDRQFLEALASLEGLVPYKAESQSSVFARTVDRRMIALHVPSDRKLDLRWVDSVMPTMAGSLSAGVRVRVYYHRGTPPTDVCVGRLEFRRIPYELILLAGIH